MKSLVVKAESFVINLLNEKLNSKFLYHNIAHTQRVVEKVNDLANLKKITPEDFEKLLIAAWFHDTGFTVEPCNHEEESVKISSQFLRDNNIDDNFIADVTNLILVTKLNSKPTSYSEKLIKDADCSHLGSKNYEEFSLLLHKELELTTNENSNEIKWVSKNIDFLTNQHTFFTTKASKKWGKQKGKNLAQLLKQEKKLKQEAKKLKQKKDEFAFKKSKVKLPERGIETMFRVALRNHITLSDIADTKANILLSVNAIIISMIFSTLFPKLDNESNSYLILPSVIFIFFTVASIILSILATRPNVTHGKFNKKDVINKKVNLLFFGNFHKMKLNDFEWAMDEMMKDRDYLYGSLTKDLYFLGLVLNRKYNLLRSTYTVFMIGIIVSVLAFIIAFYFQSDATTLKETVVNTVSSL